MLLLDVCAGTASGWRTFPALSPMTVARRGWSRTPRTGSRAPAPPSPAPSASWPSSQALTSVRPGIVSGVRGGGGWACLSSLNSWRWMQLKARWHGCLILSSKRGFNCQTASVFSYTYFVDDLAARLLLFIIIEAVPKWHRLAWCIVLPWLPLGRFTISCVTISINKSCWCLSLVDLSVQDPDDENMKRSR